MILSNVLIYYDYHIFLSNIFGKYISKIFKVSKNATQVIILSLLTSAPSNGIFINDMLINNLITKKEANKLACFTCFPSLSYVVFVIGWKLFNSYKVGILLLITNFLYNLFIGLYLRSIDTYDNNIYIKNNNISFFNMLRDTIINSFSTLAIIFGILCIFNTFVNLVIFYIDINKLVLGIINGILEFSSGILFISKLSISFNLKLSITSFILNFNSLSIMFQLSSIIKEKLDIKKILIIKLIFSLLTSLIVFFIASC